MQVHNPFNPPIAAPPPIAMPSTSTLIPGPFILLLLLPSIPLLLFSIGARPPDTSALPFSMMEVFTTAAFVSIAGGVVLSLVIWPEVGQNVGGWIRGGQAATMGTGPRPSMWERIKGGDGAKAGVYMAQHSSGGGQGQIQGVRGAVRRVASATRGRAAARLYAIRSRLNHLYNPSRPHTPTALGITVLLLAVLVVIFGNFLRGLYELDGAAAPSRSDGGDRSSKGDGGDLTPWVMAEIKKRQTELKAGKTPEQTLARYKKDAEGERNQMKDKVERFGPEKGKEYRKGKEKEREKELKALLGRLVKLKLTTIGVEGADKINAKAEGGTVGGDEAGGGDQAAEEGAVTAGAVDGLKKKWGAWFKRGGEAGRKEEKKESAPLGEKVKRFILPVPSSAAGSGVTKQKAMLDAAMLNAMPARGPGWEMADDPHSGAALAKSASNAESLAARMKAGG